MSNWNVKFDGADPGLSDDFTLSFVDLDNIVKSENQFALTDKYVNEVLSFCENRNNYYVIGNIKEIISPRGTDFSDKKIYVLMGIHATSQKLGCLLGQYKDDGWLILGLWPDYFAESVKWFHKSLKIWLMDFIISPNDWKRVDVVIPKTG